MSDKHTSGPWVVVTNRAGYPYAIHAPNGDNTKPGAVGTHITRWASISLPSSQEGRANAVLMAAAPNMLAALRRAALALAFAAEKSAAMQDDYEAVSAAIAEATKDNT